MKVGLKEYSEYVKDLIRGTPTQEVVKFVKSLPEGTTKHKFGIYLSGKTIRLKSPFYALPAVFQIAKKVSPSKDYELSLRILQGHDAKIISKNAPEHESVKQAKKELLEGQSVDRIYYEILKTEDYEITYSEFEGTIIQANEYETIQKLFHALVGLFPFADVGKENRKLEVFCEFNIDELKKFKKKQDYRGDLKCTIYLDEEPIGTRGNSFIF